ncbi:MAG: adenine phosphoribosyltransferase [Alphaproteobacteria bacterium]|nr:adenine phosphoribosyltransferase [Alphaproteobacteria bacterium]
MKIEDSKLTFVKDYPIKGVNFIDINGVLAHPIVYHKVINSLCRQVQKIKQEFSSLAILTPESRGFLFAPTVAYKTNLPIVTIRKKGKIPNKPYRFSIQNEYDSYEMEIDSDILSQFNNYIYIDDILATGQTLAHVSKALRRKQKHIVLALHLTAVSGLKSLRHNNPILQEIPHKEIIK